MMAKPRWAFLYSCIVLIGFSAIAQESSIEIKKRLEGHLEKEHRYGYTAGGFGFLQSGSVTDSQFLDGLKKFEQALNLTKSVKDFAKQGHLLFHEDMPMIAHDQYGRQITRFPLDMPAQAWVGLLSKNPEKEPAYQAYLKKNRESYLPNLVLEQTALNLMRERFNFGKGTKISGIMGQEGVSIEQHRKAIRNLIEAAKKVRYPRQLFNTFTLSIGKDYREPPAGNSGKNIQFSADFSPEQWIRHFSARPDSEPEAQSLFAKLNKIDPKLENYTKTAKKLVCRKLTKESLDGVVNQTFGAKVAKISENKIPASGGYYTRTHIYLTPASKGRIIVEKLYRHSKEKEGEDQLQSRIVRFLNSTGAHSDKANARFTPSCYLERVDSFQRDVFGRLTHRYLIDSNGEIQRTVMASPPIAATKDVLKACPKKIQHPVKVAIWDSGVDYNNKAIRPHLSMRPMTAKQKEKVSNSLANYFSTQFTFLPTNSANLMIGAPMLYQRLKENSDVLRTVSKENVDGWNFYGDNQYFYDYWPVNPGKKEDFDHGTAVASVAIKDNPNVALIPIRRPFKYKDFYKSLKYAKEKGARIVTLSLGTYNIGAKLKINIMEGVEKAIREFDDILFVAASGNDGVNLDKTPFFPASFNSPKRKYKNLVTIGYAFNKGWVVPNSNYGKNTVDFVAPGVGVPVQRAGGGVSYWMGSSFAAPYVANVAAKMLAINPTLRPEQLVGLMKNSIDPVAGQKEKTRFGGILNPEKAAQEARKSLVPLMGAAGFLVGQMASPNPAMICVGAQLASTPIPGAIRREPAEKKKAHQPE